MTQAQIETIVDAVRRETGVPGLALCVEQDGKRWFAASGTVRTGSEMPLARAARFDVSCLMKFFLSVMALKLKAQGALDPSSDIAAHLPELGAGRGMQLLHLMSHASGYHGLDITDMAVRWNSKWESFAARFRQEPQLFPPGAIFNYEHSEHVILGEILRRRFRIAPEAMVADMLLAQADVRLRPSADGDDNICAHVFSSQRGGYAPTKLPPFGPFWAASLPALTISLDEAVSGVKLALGDPAIARDLRQPLIGLPEMARSENRAEKPPRQFTAACGIYDDSIIGHNGSMFGQTLGFRADARTGAVAAAGVNAYSADARDAALRRVLDFLAGQEQQPSAKESPGPLWHRREGIFGDLTPDDAEGRYIGSYLGAVTVARDGAGFRVTVGPPGNRQSGFKLASDGNGRWAIESRMPVSLRFQKAPDGKAILFLGVHSYKSMENLPGG